MVVVDYMLGETIDAGTGVRKCKLIFDGVQDDEDYSARVFPTYREAERASKSLKAIDAEGLIASPKFPVKGNNVGEGGVLVMEAMTSFMNGWLNVEGKPNMWRYNPSNRKLIGFGMDAKKEFLQIGKAMLAINGAGVPHGNLQNGIMLGADGNIRILNFMIPEVEVQACPKSPRPPLEAVGADGKEKLVVETIKRGFDAYIALIKEAYLQNP